MENLIAWYKEKGFESVTQGIQTLKDELGIKVKEYPNEDLYVFNYCQIESPKTHPVVMECRGLILEDDFSPVCRPFDRFFNYGEALDITEQVDIKNSIAYEKADGSLVKVYHDGLQWQVASRGTAFAESENYTGEVFRDLIIKAFGCVSIVEWRSKVSECLDKDNTYIFEYVSPNNRVVTPYKEDKMYTLGARNTLTGLEIDTSNCLIDMQDKGLNVVEPKQFKFNSADDIKDFVNDLTDLQEGVVVKDLSNGIRFKMKADKYVAVHRLRGDSVPSPKKICALVVTNETGEYLSYFPEEESRFKPYIDHWSNLKDFIINDHKVYGDIADQKEFALQVKDKLYSFVLFQARSKNKSAINVLNSLDQNKKIKLLTTYIEDQD